MGQEVDARECLARIPPSVEKNRANKHSSKVQLFEQRIFVSSEEQPR